MARLQSLFSVKTLRQHIEDGNVAVNQHPTLPLKLLTYTRQAQYTHAWDSVTKQCRGLVVESPAGVDVDELAVVVARPLEKFFNYQEHQNDLPYAGKLPDGPFKILEKADGSLGVVFHYADRWHVATKGSFTSDQAVWAQAYLDAHADYDRFDTGVTYLSEIIYPDNRIVVNYGDTEEMILLAIRETDTGKYGDLEQRGWVWSGIGRMVEQYPPMSLDQLLTFTQKNEDINDFNPAGPATVSGVEAEGFVLRWSDDTMCKIKYADYVTLHSIMTGLRTVDVWRIYGAHLLRDQTDSSIKEIATTLGIPEIEAASIISKENPFNDLLENIPDEVDEEVKHLAYTYASQAGELHEVVDNLYLEVTTERPELLESRAEFAKWVKTFNGGSVVSALLFTRHDNNQDKMLRQVWKAVKPASQPVFQASNNDEG